LEDIQKAATGIYSFNSYQKMFALLAQKAVKENRLKNAAFYFREAWNDFRLSEFRPK
jgi:hypothetical protein